MKRMCIFALVLTIALGLSACGRRNNTPDDGMTILPTMDSTIDTNIPDPDVDTKMPIYTDGTDASDWTDATQETDTPGARSRRGY